MPVESNMLKTLDSWCRSQTHRAGCSRLLKCLPCPACYILTFHQKKCCIRDTILYTAISRKVVGKSARDNPVRYCGWFWVHCFSKKFQRMAGESMDVCLRVLKESNKSRFDSYGVRKSALIISRITFRDCRVHSFSDNLSRNSCITKCVVHVVVQISL